MWLLANMVEILIECEMFFSHLQVELAALLHDIGTLPFWSSFSFFCFFEVMCFLLYSH